MTSSDSWVAAASDLLAELAVGVMACRMYSTDHPRAKRARERVARRFDELFQRMAQEEARSGGAPEIELALLQNELFFHGRPFTRSSEKMGLLIRLLHQHRIERATFLPGLDHSEIARFMVELARLDAADLPAFDRIKIDRRASAVETGEGASQQQPQRLGVVGRVALLGEAVAAAAAERPLPWSGIHGIVEQLLRQVGQAPNPLALLAPYDDGDWQAVHAHNTAALSLVLALPLGFDERLCRDIGVAAAVHDAGKFGIASDLIEQELRLTGLQWELSFDHSRRGLELLLAAPEAPEVAPVVAFDHHLRQDGGGFPILPEPRRPHPAAALVAVAEAFDIMLTVRVARGTIGRDEISPTFRAGAGTVFDPELALLAAAIWETCR